MKTALEKDIREHKERVTELEDISPVDNGEEIRLLKQLIEEKEKELEQFSSETINAELAKVDARSGLPLEVREIIKNDLGVEEEEKEIAQEAQKIKEEINSQEKLSESEIKSREDFEEANFIASFDISPDLKRELKQYLETMREVGTTPNQIMYPKEFLPREIFKTAYMRTHAERVFRYSIIECDGLGSGGDWEKYRELFNIPEAFFTQKDFDKYKKKSWMGRIANGQSLKFKEKTALDKHSKYSMNLFDDTDSHLQYGNLSYFIDVTSPQIRQMALVGISKKLTSKFFERDISEVLTQYTELFHLSDEEIEKAILGAMSEVDLKDADTLKRIKGNHEVIKKFLESDAGKDMAKKQVREALIRNDEYDAEKILNNFGLSLADIDQKNIASERGAHLLTDIKTEISRQSEYLLSMMEREKVADNISPEKLKAIIVDIEKTEYFFKMLTKEITHTWNIQANAEFIKKLGISPDILKRATVCAIGHMTGGNRERLEKKEVVLEVVKEFGFSDTELEEGLSLGLAYVAQRTTNQFELLNFKQIYGLEKVVNSGEVQQEVKKIYLKALSSVDMEELKLLDKEFSITWLPEDLELRKKAVKEALIENLEKFSINTLSVFLESQYPETHKIFLLKDPEVQASVRKKLVRMVTYNNSFYSIAMREKNVNGFIKYFDIPEDEIRRLVAEKIKDSFISRDEESNLRIFFPNFDFKSHNDAYLEQHGIEQVNAHLEYKNWNQISVLQKYENGKTNRYIQELIEKEKKNIQDASKDPHTRLYAIECVANLSPDAVKSGGIRFIEDTYLKNVVDIYTGADVKKLSELFSKNSSVFLNLDETVRENAFNALIKSGYEGISAILKTNLVASLSKEQIVNALPFNATTCQTTILGLMKAIVSGPEISKYVFDCLYNYVLHRSRVTDGNPAPQEYVTSMKTFLQFGIDNQQMEPLMRHQNILKEIATDPKSVEKIIQMMDEFPKDIIRSKWDYIYTHFKALSEHEFHRQKKIVDRVSPHINADNNDFEGIFERMLVYTQEQQDELIHLLALKEKPPSGSFDEKNWNEGLLRYICASENFGMLDTEEPHKANILEAMNGKYRDIVLNKLHTDWINFLGNNQMVLPPNSFIIGRVIHHAGGAGNLKHVESLGNLIHGMEIVLEKPKTAERTRMEVKDTFTKQESKFEKEKWSQDDRSEFYNLSRDIMRAAPSLFAAFAPVFEQLSAKDMKLFVQEVLPFYQAHLVTVQEIEDNAPVYDPRDLVTIRQSVAGFADRLRTSEEKKELFTQERSRLLEIVKSGFKNRFGLMKIPETFTHEDLRTIQNGIRYIGNISGRDVNRETIIALYIGLTINGEWEAFRQGKEIKLDEYFSKEKVDILKPLIETKLAGYEALGHTAKVSKEEMLRFQEILQDEVISSVMGNINTVDVKLGNIKRNIEELTDPDAYQNARDKKVVALLVENGRLVGTVLARIYAESSGKVIDFNAEEQAIKSKLETIYSIKKWSPEEVKKIQDAMQPFSLVVNMVNKMEEEKVEENIKELHQLLMPNEDVVKIFNRLGEDFKPESGAFALSKDLAYLESLVVKDDKKLTDEEKTIVRDYIGSIHKKMKELESTLDKVRGYFDKVKKSSHFENQDLLKNRLAEIEKILYSTDSNAMIVSRMTKDLNLVIENMRQCLGCIRQEANNDTNLAFGDYNKFFMINQSEKEKGSISDEIVFFVPIKLPDGSEEMSFVLDRVYGSKSADVLLSNVISVYKKYSAIKKEFPHSKVCIAVTEAAISSVGMSSELFSKTLSNAIQNLENLEFVTDVVATIPESSFSDNYVEFAGAVRSSGDRTFSGLVLK